LWTFDEALELLGSDGFCLQLDLERHEDAEEKLVLLVEASRRVCESVGGQRVDDILDALGGDRRLGRSSH